jgi:integrase
VDGEPLPPFTILVRRQWNLGKMESTKRKSRKRALPIPPGLLPILIELKQRKDFTGPDDFVLVSRRGTPIDAHNYANRGLKTIGKELGMPWLSWHVFRRTHTTLTDELGMELTDRQAMMGHGNVAMTIHYTQRSLERRRATLEQLTSKLLEKPQGTVN